MRRRAGRYGKPQGGPLEYTPAGEPARELLAFVEKCRETGWTVARIAKELLGVDKRTLHRWLEEKRPVPARVSSTIRCVTGITAKAVTVQLEASKSRGPR